MKKKISRLAIIPARSGSKRILNKNIKNFYKKPIINYSINNAIKSRLFEKIHISTDSLKMKNFIEKNNNLKIDFLRIKKLYTDRTPLINVIRYVTKEYIKKKETYDEIWLIYACAPLTKASDLINASKNYQRTNKKLPMMSFRKYDAPIEWSFKKKKNIFIPNFRNKITIDSKNIKPNYYESASFIIFKPEQLIKKIKFSKYYGHELPRERAIDIDDLSDWKIAESLYKFNYKI